MPYTPEELHIIKDSDLLRTKRKAIEHTVILFQEVKRALKELDQSSYELPPAAWNSLGKISKGENYQGLPFVVLDYPSIFEKRDIFTIRTMFWWGNYFSVFVLAKGKYQACIPLNVTNISKSYSLNISNDMWNFNLNDTKSFMKLREVSKTYDDNIYKKLTFISLSSKLPLETYQTLPQFVISMLNSLFRKV